MLPGTGGFRGRRWQWLTAALVLATAALGGAAWYVHGGKERGERLIEYQLWPRARQQLHWYVRLHPADYEARLRLAEAYYRDESLKGEQAAAGAMQQLGAIPDDAPQGAQARTQQGRVELFLRHRPSRARDWFHRALALDPHLVEANFLMWKLHELIGQSESAEPYFWPVFEQTEEGMPRAERLREWYMTQFYPTTANPALEAMMGLPPDPDNPLRGEARRCLRFREAEPDRPIGHTGLARAFQQDGDKKFAKQLLDIGAKAMKEKDADPAYLATLISVTHSLGEYRQAEAAFQRWPEPHEGFEYWRSQALILHEIRGEYAKAAEAYEKALAVWPGQVSWRVINRYADCLTRLRRTKEAAAARQKATDVINEMTEEQLRELRNALAVLDDPHQVMTVAAFYRRIDRPREAEAWESHVRWLQLQKQSES